MFPTQGLMADHQIIERLNRKLEGKYVPGTGTQEHDDGYRKDSIVIHPLVDRTTQIQQVSVDLRLGQRLLRPPSASYVNTKRPMSVEMAESMHEEILLDNETPYIDFKPGDALLWETLEYVRLPTDIAGKVMGKSTYGRLFVLVHVTAGLIDPGFAGRITLELVNVGPHTIRLCTGMRLCQITFHRMGGSVSRPYGSANNTYLNSQTVRPPRVNVDQASQDLQDAFRFGEITSPQDLQSFLNNNTYPEPTES